MTKRNAGIITTQAAAVRKREPSLDDHYQSALRRARGAGWYVISEGPSGAQLQRSHAQPLTLILALLGTVALFIVSIALGILLLVAAGICHLCTRAEHRFLSRNPPKPLP